MGADQLDTGRHQGETKSRQHHITDTDRKNIFYSKQHETGRVGNE